MFCLLPDTYVITTLLSITEAVLRLCLRLSLSIMSGYLFLEQLKAGRAMVFPALGLLLLDVSKLGAVREVWGPEGLWGITGALHRL
jgi:hypothetical protein